MATSTLATMASELVVAARRSESSGDVFGEVSAFFERYQAGPPVELYRQTTLAGPLTLRERRILATRWQRVFEELLAAHPDAEPSLLALIETMRRLTGPALTVPAVSPAPPAAPKPQPVEVAGPDAAPEPPPDSAQAWPGAAPEPPPDSAQPWPDAAPQPPPDSAQAWPDAASDRGYVSRGAPGAPPQYPGAAPPVAPAAPAPSYVSPAYAPGGPDPVSVAIQSAVRPGLLAFNPPDEMTQGRAERIEVGVARSAELMEALVAGLRGRGQVHIEQLPTSAFMSVELRGDSFVIKELSRPSRSSRRARAGSSTSFRGTRASRG